tara:strand:+ start:331 stop:1383 length:1053 start_codon:yes stop_codon:yes gene_type:complete
MLKKIEEIYELSPFCTPNMSCLAITNTCNLKCKYCYQNQDAQEILNAEVWLTFLDHFRNSSSDDKLVTITGGEPLISKDSRNTVARISKKAKEEEMTVTMVSNGMHFKDFFLEHSMDNIDCFDISVDGPENINDSIRGKGSYKKAMEGLKVLQANNVKQIFISSVLSVSSSPNVLENFLKEMIEKGINNFVFHCLAPGQKKKNRDMMVQDENFLKILASLQKVQQTNTAKEIIIDVYPASFKDFEKMSSKIYLEEIFLDENNFYIGVAGKNLFLRFVNDINLLITTMYLSPNGSAYLPMEQSENRFFGSINDIKKGNPNKNKVRNLIENIKLDCLDKQCFKFCLGQNIFC